MRQYNRGDIVVYAKQKWSASPGPNARLISASSAGDSYSYVVNKFWVVVDSQHDGVVRVRTRTGKERTVREDDSLLRRPSLFERALMRHRFPRLS